MRPVAILMILAGSLLLAGCESAPAHKTAASKSGTQPACICGTHEAQLHGCPAPACMSGAGDPDNPQCRCAALTPTGAKAGGQ